MTVKKVDQDLGFYPGAVDNAEKLSLSFKGKNFLILGAENIVLITVPLSLLIGVLFWYYHLYYFVGLYAITALLLNGSLSAVELRIDYAKKWQTARSVSESIKRELWLYCMSFEEYGKGSIHDQQLLLIDKIRRLIHEIERVGVIIEQDNEKGFFYTDQIQLLKEQDIHSKYEKYLEDRLRDQISWYSKMAKYNKQRKRMFGSIYIGLQVIAIFAAGILMFYHLTLTETVDLIVAAALATRSFSTAKRFDELAFTYSNTSMQLEGIRESSKVFDSVTDKDLYSMVRMVEETISREHEIWVLRGDKTKTGFYGYNKKK